MSLEIKRHFTQSGVDPYSMFEYEKRDCIIKDKDGDTVFSFEGAEVPKQWSVLATDILISKYFRKSGVPETDTEISVKQVVHRIANSWMRWGLDGKYFDEINGQIFYDEIVYLLLSQSCAPNSPQWFNTGLYEAYGITGTYQGFWYTDPVDGQLKESDTSYVRPQPHACFILDVTDDLVNPGGIMDLWVKESKIFKFGSGAGTNFSNIREKGSPLNNGGKSSGLMSFLDIGDRSAGAIKSGGTTRRAAKMVILDMDHPEILEFVDWKLKEEDKVKVLIAGGYDSHFEGEAYRTIGGQNSNNSVRIGNYFMECLRSMPDREWSYKSRMTGNDIPSGISIKDHWDRVCDAAWKCADPGVQYHDNINEWHTCPNTAPIRASNPCSEYMFIDNTACNLASINLMKYMHEGRFDTDGFCHTVDLLTLALEISVYMASFPTKEIAKWSYLTRTLGLGYANLGSVFMSLGLPYDSVESRELASHITCLMQIRSYLMSSIMAQHIAPFSEYEKNKIPMNAVVERHISSLTNISIPSSFNYIRAQISDDSQRLRYMMENGNGFRNAQVTVIAPTGTIGLLMDCDTTGIEPDFALVKYKKMVGGGYAKIVNQTVPLALKTMGYQSDDISSIIQYINEHGTVEGCPEIDPTDIPVFDCANKSGEGNRFIRYMAHIEMMAAVQPFISGAISKTVNLPNDATVDDIDKTYYIGWEMGLKAIAVYRDGCKQSQPLNTVNKTEDTQIVSVFSEHKRLPNTRKGLTHKVNIDNHSLYIRTGEYPDGRLGELFLDISKEGSTLKSLLNSTAIAISVGLQHGVPLSNYVDKYVFTNFSPNGIVIGNDHIKTCTSILDFVFRWLNETYNNNDSYSHIKSSPVDRSIENKKIDTVHSGAPLCSKCGSITVMSGTCYLCHNCGTTTGCA